MSTLRNPVGPKDRKVYFRRRLIVLAVLLAVIAVVVLIVVKPGSNQGAKDAASVEVPSDLPSDASQDEDSEKDDDEVSVCDAGQLAVTPVTDRGSYAEGELPVFSMSIENTGNEACSADLGTAGMSFEVTSGEDEVWRSTDCQEDPESLAVILDPGKALETEGVEWDRTRSSAETCDISRDPVVTGGASYHLHASAAGTEGAETAQFILN